MERERSPISRPVVQGERRTQERPERLVGRQRAEGAPIAKEKRDVAKIPQEEVVLDCVGIVEMERIMEVI